MRALLCGSRTWTDNGAVLREIRLLLEEHGNGITIITGGASGADRMAGSWAKTLGVNHICVNAKWNEHGRRAGHIRNLLMLDMEPEIVVAFWDGESRGTKHTLTEARKRGIPTKVLRAEVLA